MSTYDKIHFGIIRVVHETLYGRFVNPYSKLNIAGLKLGQKVLEVGCGPGFFTIPASKIAGAEAMFLHWTSTLLQWNTYDAKSNGNT